MNSIRNWTIRYVQKSQAYDACKGKLTGLYFLLGEKGSGSARRCHC